MNIFAVLKELRCELEKINRAIAALEPLGPPQIKLLSPISESSQRDEPRPDHA